MSRPKNDDSYFLGFKIVALKKFRNGWQIVRVRWGNKRCWQYEWLPRWRPN